MVTGGLDTTIKEENVREETFTRMSQRLGVDKEERAPEILKFVRVCLTVKARQRSVWTK